MLPGTSASELALALLLLLLIVLAPKVPKIGEAIGGVFERRSSRGPEQGTAGERGGSGAPSKPGADDPAS
jgi:hypothetical protein